MVLSERETALKSRTSCTTNFVTIYYTISRKYVTRFSTYPKTLKTCFGVSRQVLQQQRSGLRFVPTLIKNNIQNVSKFLQRTNVSSNSFVSVSVYVQWSVQPACLVGQEDFEELFFTKMPGSSSENHRKLDIPLYFLAETIQFDTRCDSGD